MGENGGNGEAAPKQATAAELLAARKGAQGPDGLHQEIQGHEPRIRLSDALKGFTDSIQGTVSSLVSKYVELGKIHQQLSGLGKKVTSDHIDESRRAQALEGEIAQLESKLTFRFPADIAETVRKGWKDTDGGKELLKLGRSKVGSFNILPVTEKNGAAESLSMLKVVHIETAIPLKRGRVLKTAVEDITPPPEEGGE